MHACNITSNDSKTSSATDFSCPGTSKGIQIDSAPRQKSSILTDNTGATLSAHANVGPFIAEGYLEAGNGTSSDLQISSATDMSCSGTTRGMQINFTTGQTSSNLVGIIGATLTFHADAMREDYMNAGKCGNVNASKRENSSYIKICSERHLGESSSFDATRGCFETSGAALRESELVVADIGGNARFFDDSAWCVLSFSRVVCLTI